MPFKIPLMPAPDPSVVPSQVAYIQLAKVCTDNAIPASEDLSLRFTVLSTPINYVSYVALWR